MKMMTRVTNKMKMMKRRKNRVKRSKKPQRIKQLVNHQLLSIHQLLNMPRNKFQHLKSRKNQKVFKVNKMAHLDRKLHDLMSYLIKTDVIKHKSLRLNKF